MELAIFSGMSASELRGLPWSNVDLKRGTVTVSQRADAQGNIGAPKSEAGHRTIALPPRVITAMKAWKLACPVSMMLKLVGPVQIAAKVTGPQPEDPESSPPPRYGMHAFRHAAASLWIEQGLDPKRVQTLMGHSSIQMTFDTYGHLFEQARKDRDDAAAIERALFADAT